MWPILVTQDAYSLTSLVRAWGNVQLNTLSSHYRNRNKNITNNGSLFDSIGSIDVVFFPDFFLIVICTYHYFRSLHMLSSDNDGYNLRYRRSLSRSPVPTKRSGGDDNIEYQSEESEYGFAIFLNFAALIELHYLLRNIRKGVIGKKCKCNPSLVWLRSFHHFEIDQEPCVCFKGYTRWSSSKGRVVR